MYFAFAKKDIFILQSVIRVCAGVQWGSRCAYNSTFGMENDIAAESAG